MKNPVLAFTLIACLLQPASVATAATRDELNAMGDEALQKLYADSPAAERLGAKAKGILIFPRVVKAGFGVGGEYGEGVLLEQEKPVAYYSTAAASVGFQVGAQVKTQILMFMNEDVLDEFKNAEGWEAGVNGSVAIASFGAGGSLDTKTAREPIIGFIFGNKGLMYNLSIEGSKFTEIRK